MSTPTKDDKAATKTTAPAADTEPTGPVTYEDLHDGNTPVEQAEEDRIAYEKKSEEDAKAAEDEAGDEPTKSKVYSTTLDAKE